MNNFLFRSLLAIQLLCITLCQAQKAERFDLPKLLAGNKLNYNAKENIAVLRDGDKQAISSSGIVWIKDSGFTTGSIDVDLRGKNVFQQSFLGIAFHRENDTTYECIYFRPFNYQSPDTLRRKHSVQYISEPIYHWDVLRAAHPLVYENAVPANITSIEWFHAHIVVTETEVIVYVNNQSTASLKVKRLTSRNSGNIGLWNDGLPGDFANLIIKPTTK